jgi:hypothetical protein
MPVVLTLLLLVILAGIKEMIVEFINDLKK